MSDNREIARRYVETWLNLTSDWDAARNEMVTALDAATERGRRQGWSAEARAALEWIEQRCNEGSNDVLADRETIHAIGRKARAAIAAIPAPPAGESERG